MEKKSKKVCCGLFLSGAFLLVFALILLFAARRVPGFAERYTKTVYPVLVAGIGRFWGLLPFSVSEIGLYLLFAGLLFALIRFLKRPLLLLLIVFFAASALLFSYAACCGINYYRIPFSSYYLRDLKQAAQESGEGLAAPDDDDLRALCQWLTEGLNEAHAQLERHDGNYKDMQKKGVAAMKGLAEEYPDLSGYYPQPKPVLISWILSVQQCSGIYSPFAIEANYNRDMVAYNIPHTICHELSHLRGFMREDEANFIGYLACMRSDDADFNYSGYMLGWIYAGNALARVDFEEYVRLHEMLDENIRIKLEENNAFWDRYEGKVAETANQVNDTYLKANGQSEGIKTYGRVVDLMLLDFVK